MNPRQEESKEVFSTPSKSAQQENKLTPDAPVKSSAHMGRFGQFGTFAPARKSLLVELNAAHAAAEAAKAALAQSQANGLDSEDLIRLSEEVRRAPR
jgi:hypothetical protein